MAAVDCGVDPLRWELLWVNGVCYRQHPKLTTADSRRRGHKKVPKEFTDADMEENDDGAYRDEPSCGRPGGREDNKDEAEEEQAAHTVRVHVPDKYVGRVCGHQHSRRKELERETRTTIAIPEKGAAESDIVISGDSAEHVAECADRIRGIVAQARAMDSFTHFVSIPLAVDVVRRNLKEFQALVLGAMSTSTLSERMFVRERKLHLTLCCLSCHDRYEVSQVADILQDCHDLVDKHLHGQPITLNIRGLEIMNDDPSTVDVLYAKVYEEGRPDAGRLQALCDAIADRFRSSGYLVGDRERASLKLHMTLINSKFAAEPSAVVNPAVAASHRGNSSNKRLNEHYKAFSAVKILREFGNYDFGSVRLGAVELNVVSQVEPGTGYYKGVARLKLAQTDLSKPATTAE